MSLKLVYEDYIKAYSIYDDDKKIEVVFTDYAVELEYKSSMHPIKKYNFGSAIKDYLKALLISYGYKEYEMLELFDQVDMTLRGC